MKEYRIQNTSNTIKESNSLSDSETTKLLSSHTKQRFKKSNLNYYHDSSSIINNEKPSTYGINILSSSLPTTATTMRSSKVDGYSTLAERQEDLYTDDEQVTALSADELFDDENQNNRTRALKTGRQRKRLAARSKGSEFRANRKKKRVYFCCISSEIDIPKLVDQLLEGQNLFLKWKYRVYSDVLHIYREDLDIPIYNKPISINNNNNNQISLTNHEYDLTPRIYQQQPTYQSNNYNGDSSNISTNYDSNYHRSNNNNYVITNNELSNNSNEKKERTNSIGEAGYSSFYEDNQTVAVDADKSYFRITNPGAQEVFIFDFGAVVFWGVPRQEETQVLRILRNFVNKGMVGPQEFASGEDDMAFVTSIDANCIKIANDVIELPDNSEPKQRLSVSFAIAQSSVLAIFESRIEKKVEEYKYIPEALAAYGKVHLSELQLGMMIGEVFVIRHDVNLHTEILDTPDFFWKEETFESDYQMVMSYLEMSGRTEILNKRLDMLRELLDVLQQQMENSHAVKLEWIVIYLIIAEVALQIIKILGY